MLRRPLRKIFLPMMFLLAGCDHERAETVGARENAAIVYGEDGRRDPYEVKDQTVVTLARSSVAIFLKENVKVAEGWAKITGFNFGQVYNLCPTEKFRSQSVGANCSGFLVTPDSVVTAAHCVKTSEDCRGILFIFDYELSSLFGEKALLAGAPTAGGGANSILPASKIYKCVEVVRSEQSARADYAVLKLDRAVKDREPLRLRRSGAPEINDPLVVIGYPSGLPQKITFGGKVLSVDENQLLADVDAYVGNSGSAVLNEATGLVEGILVSGESDFVTQGQCTVTNRCASTSVTEFSKCRGENITRISHVLPFIQ